MAHTFVTQKNGVIVKTTLYGEVTPDRLQKETRLAEYRVEQLQPSRGVRQERERVERRRETQDDWNAAWDGSYQSTGR